MKNTGRSDSPLMNRADSDHKVDFTPLLYWMVYIINTSKFILLLTPGASCIIHELIIMMKVRVQLYGILIRS